MDDSSPTEATKRWGFRRSTIARREFIEEIGNLDLVTLTPRRTARQPKGKARGRGRAKQPNETIPTPPKRTRAGRGAIQVRDVDPESDDIVAAPRQPHEPQKAAFEASDQDSDELTLRELQERARRRRKSEEIQQESAELNDEGSRENVQADQDVSSLADQSGITGARKSAPGGRHEGKVDPEGRNDAGESSSIDEYSDPEAIYCICQQKHNNRQKNHVVDVHCSKTQATHSAAFLRFMIRCDRCHEWFHGDCVGISQSRGSLLEKNGEDYICPSCSPCQSPIRFLNQQQQPVLCKVLSSSSESLLTSSAGEERPNEDDGVKGKIRKSSSRGTKTRIKIFRPVETLEATSKLEERAVAGEQDVTEETVEDQEDLVEKEKEKATAPQCIGPGCSNDALPESVYCGHQCIIRHAAVAMHGLSEPKAQPEIKNKPAIKPTLKIQNLGKLFKKKPSEKPDEDGRSKEMGSAPAASFTPDPVHKAMGEQQPAAIASSLFYKATSTKPEKEAEESEPDKTPVTTQPESPDPSAPSEASAAKKVAEKPASSSPPLKRPASNPLPSRAKKTMPGSPRLSATRQLLNEASQCQSQEASSKPQSSNPTTEVRVLPITPAPVPPPRPLQAHPNMQMRQNIRRSLADTLLKRVSASDDLEIPESEVEKLAVNIEREMFNMYYTTDNKYKTKYRSLILSLKDPKNKVLFYEVVKGHITPFKLTRLSDQELLSVQENTDNPVAQKEHSSPVCADVEQPVSVSKNIAVKPDSMATSSMEGKISLPPAKQKPCTAVSAIISTMLKDTTAEHKAHLFDLKCRICTGQISEDTDTTKKDEPKTEQKEKLLCAFALSAKTPALGDDSLVIESPASPNAEECNVETPQKEFSPPVIPAVSIVTITRKDPRTAGYRAAPSTAIVPAHVLVPDPPKSLTIICSEKETTDEPKAVEPPPPPPPPPMPKSILMKPSAPSNPMFYSSQGLTTRLRTSHTPADKKTINFLSRQDTIWKGFLNMQLVAKFVTKGCMISGSAEALKKDLPDTVHIGGRILPEIVWEYVERVKTSLTKELSLIRFYPASDEEEVAYVSLFSYFNSRRRFGVVSNICNNIKDLYLIPLCANESIPSVLLPIEGPGLEQDHPNLLIGLAVCQKLKRPGAQTHDIDEKRPRIQISQDPQSIINLPTKSTVPDAEHDEPYDPDIAIGTTPGNSQPDPPSPFSNPSSVLSNFHAPKTSTISDVAKITSLSAPPNSSTTSTTTTTTPLQTILDTIFGKKTHNQDLAGNTSQETPIVKEPAISFLTVDPIVQQYQQTSKAAVENDGNDRPYDPEEEYDPALGYQNLSPVKPLELSKPNTSTDVSKSIDGVFIDDDDRPYDPEEEYNLGNRIDSVHARSTANHSVAQGTSAIKDDVAYDPEDDTVFEEMQNYLTDKKPSTSEYGPSTTMSLSEQQKMLEDLNRQIEEQKRQLEEQEEALRLQRAAVGVSMAHFSVSDALMSPPPRFGREPDEEMEKTLTAINLNRDPRQYRNLTSNTVNPTLTDHTDNENEKRECSKSKNPSKGLLEQEKDQAMSLGEVDNKMLTSADTTVLHSVRNSEKSIHPGPSELQESTSSSSGNENIQRSNSPSKDSGKPKQSHTSRRQHHSPSQRQSRHEPRRPYHEKRTSDQSKDDGHRRRSRRPSERSSRRSRSRSCRNERTSSREREQNRHRSTSSRHGSRRDRWYSSSRARSPRSRASSEPENNQSSLKEKSASRQKNEPNSAMTDTVASEQPESEKSQNEALESAEPKETTIQKDALTKPESDQSHHREQAASDKTCGTFSQRKQVKVEPNQLQNDRTFKTNLLQREEFHKNKPQFEKLSKDHDRNNEPFYTRHQCTQRGNVLNNDKTIHIQSSRQEFHHPSQKMPKIENDFPEPVKDLPMRPPHLRGQDREMTPLQNQNTSFLIDGTSDPQEFPLQEARSMASDDLTQLENNIHRNSPPRDQFRPRTPEGQWRGPQHRLGGLRGHTSMQSRIPRAPHPEQIENCRPAGPRGLTPRIFDDCGPSEEFGPIGPTSVSRMFEDSGNRNLRPRGPSPGSRMFQGASPHPFEPKGRFPRPVMLEGSGPQKFRPRDTFLRPEMFDGSVTFAGSQRREFDRGDPHLQEFDDSWECDAPHQLDRETFSELRRPRGHGPPQRFHENRRDSRGTEQPDFDDSRCYDLTFDKAEIEHEPLQYFDDPRDYGPNFANESNLPPQQPRGHRYPTPRPMRTRIPARARNSLSNKPERPRVSRMELNVERSQQFDEFGDYAIERETVEPHFAKPDIFEGDRSCERAAQMKSPCFNPPPNLRGPRAPSPKFHNQRMLPPHTIELPEDKVCSSNFSLPSNSRPLRSHVPNASEVPNPMQSRIRLDGPTKEPDILPLRLSGPLLPTPPGGPIRFQSPRMQRPCLYNENNLPQRPPTRGHFGVRGKGGVNPGRFDNDLNNQDGETFQSHFQEGEKGEFVDREEEYSSRGNSPWCRGARRRSSTVRRGHGSEQHNREDTSERGIGRDGAMSRDSYKTRH
ncbi:death-inducer obliterator 1-like isoform X2 [Silurus meridionalis]|nr:death-inducer obliterator 1-like isoform X2 [Silurus meridionalis]